MENLKKPNYMCEKFFNKIFLQHITYIDNNTINESFIYLCVTNIISGEILTINSVTAKHLVVLI